MWGTHHEKEHKMDEVDDNSYSRELHQRVHTVATIESKPFDEQSITCDMSDITNQSSRDDGGAVVAAVGVGGADRDDEVIGTGVGAGSMNGDTVTMEDIMENIMEEDTTSNNTRAAAIAVGRTGSRTGSKTGSRGGRSKNSSSTKSSNTTNSLMMSLYSNRSGHTSSSSSSGGSGTMSSRSGRSAVAGTPNNTTSTEVLPNDTQANIDAYNKICAGSFSSRSRSTTTSRETQTTLKSDKPLVQGTAATNKTVAPSSVSPAAAVAVRSAPSFLSAYSAAPTITESLVVDSTYSAAQTVQGGLVEKGEVVNDDIKKLEDIADKRDDAIVKKEETATSGSSSSSVKADEKASIAEDAALEEEEDTDEENSSSNVIIAATTRVVSAQGDSSAVVRNDKESNNDEDAALVDNINNENEAEEEEAPTTKMIYIAPIPTSFSSSSLNSPRGKKLSFAKLKKTKLFGSGRNKKAKSSSSSQGLDDNNAVSSNIHVIEEEEEEEKNIDDNKQTIEAKESIELAYGSLHFLPPRPNDDSKTAIKEESKQQGLGRVESKQESVNTNGTASLTLDPAEEEEEEDPKEEEEAGSQIDLVVPSARTFEAIEQHDNGNNNAGTLFEKLFSCGSIPFQCDGGSNISNNVGSSVVLYDDDIDEALNIEMVVTEEEDNFATVGFFTANNQVNAPSSSTPSSPQQESGMKVTSKVLLKTKVIPGFEVLSPDNDVDGNGSTNGREQQDVIVDTVSVKIEDIADKLERRRRNRGNNKNGVTDGVEGKKTGIRMKLLKRLKSRKQQQNENNGILDSLEITHTVEDAKAPPGSSSPKKMKKKNASKKKEMKKNKTKVVERGGGKMMTVGGGDDLNEPF